MVDKIVNNISAPSATARIAILGLGEAGSAIASDLVKAAAEVVGFDPLVGHAPDGVAFAEAATDAVAGADIILSLNSATVAVEVADQVAPALAAEAVYADLNTAAPRVKAQAAGAVEPAGALFADVALMAPVPGRGVGTPCLVAGSGASRFAELMGPLGMPVEVIGEEAGAAAARKLLRSVFMKGIAAAALESLAAARATGSEEWLHGELAGVLAGADEALLERLLTGSRRHATRRVHEMEAARDMLSELGVPPRVCEAAAGWLSQLDEEEGRAT